MISGYERQIKYLDRVITRGRLGHAYLFYGAGEEQMLEIAKGVAKTLYCAAGSGLVSIIDQGDGCGECGRIDADKHPYVIRLDVAHPLVPPKKDERKEISIDDIRELKRLFSLSAPAMAWRVAILNRADTMSREATDAFLKLLEEPGERTLFLLTNPELESLASTIVSRTVPIGFWGAHQRTDAAEEKMRALVRNALERGIAGAMRFCEDVARDKESSVLAVHTLLDLLRVDLHAFGDRQEERYATSQRIKRILDMARIMETTNVNRRLALDAIFLEALADAHIPAHASAITNRNTRQ